MRIIMLGIGTVLTVLLLVKLISGKKYEKMTESLEGKDFPLKELYGIGYGWQYGKLFYLKGKKKKELMGQARLLYDVRYAEYYAVLAWVQMLTFVHIFLCAGFLLGGLMNSVMMLFIGIGAAVVFGGLLLNQMKEKVDDRQQECAIELPEVVSTMALLINSGMMLKEVWDTIAYSKEGTIYSLMQNACSDMQNGVSELDAIYRFGVLSGSPEIKKFTSSLTQSIEMGNSDLSMFLVNQSTEMWNMKKQLMLQKGEKAATKLLMPTVLIFLGIIIIVLSGAVGMLI